MEVSGGLPRAKDTGETERHNTLLYQLLESSPPQLRVAGQTSSGCAVWPPGTTTTSSLIYIEVPSDADLGSVIRETARLFGWRRTGQDIERRLIDGIVRANMLVTSDNGNWG